MKISRYAALIAMLCFTLPAFAQDEPDAAPRAAENTLELDPNAPVAADAEAPKVKARIVLEGLNNPCGVAIQPETGTVYVADSGNHQVIKVVDGKAEAVITDFPHDVYGKGPMVNIGPLGLLFLSKDTLIVGGGGLPDGEEILRVYTLPEDGKPITADQMAQSFTLAETDEVKGEGNFYALASNGESVFVTCNGDDTKGWVARATIKDGKLENYERYLATKEATEVDAPVGITMRPEGDYLVVGQMGEINIPGDSLLTYYNDDKEMKLNIQTGLNDICAVAYSQRKQLYVLDYSWMDTPQGGLFQIIKDDESDSGVRTKKLISLDKPTAMAFDSDGSLLITIVGEAEEANSKGQLIRIPAEAEL